MKKRVSILMCICSMLALISCGEIAETSSTVTLGRIIADAIDRIDGRKDKYIFA